MKRYITECQDCGHLSNFDMPQKYAWMEDVKTTLVYVESSEEPVKLPQSECKHVANRLWELGEPEKLIAEGKERNKNL